MEYVVVGFMCIVIGYGIGIAHHVRQLEAEIKLRHEWESMAKGLVQAAAEYDVVANNNTQQLKAEIAYYLDGGEEHTDAGIVILSLETFNKLRQLSAVQ